MHTLITYTKRNINRINIDERTERRFELSYKFSKSEAQVIENVYNPNTLNYVNTDG